MHFSAGKLEKQVDHVARTLVNSVGEVDFRRAARNYLGGAEWTGSTTAAGSTTPLSAVAVPCCECVLVIGGGTVAREQDFEEHGFRDRHKPFEMLSSSMDSRECCCKAIVSTANFQNYF